MPLRLLLFGPPSVRDHDRILTGAAGQPRRLALLSLLARAGDRGITRDKIIGLLWPDEEDERARRNLTHALYALRRDLGQENAIVGQSDLRLDPAIVAIDVAEFARLRSEGDLAAAAGLYTGPFLDGFHLPSSPEFERWADQERASYARQYSELLEALATAAEGAEDLASAVQWWRRLAAHDPLDARLAIRLMEALAAAGDVTGALKHARIYEVLVQQELELPPDREVLACAARLRELGAAALPARPAGVAAERPHLPSAAAAATPRHPAWRHPAVWLTIVAVLAVALALRTRHRSGSVPVLAIGEIADHRANGVPLDVGALRDMLATNLARGENVRVLSNARMYELLPPGHERDPGAAVIAARDGGATALVDGALFQLADGQLRLDLRLIATRDGEVLQALSVEGSDPYVLVDRGTSGLLGRLGGGAPTSSVADVTTRSMAAYRLYEQGLRVYTQGDGDAAEPLFAAALAEDSTFAMAAYYHALTATSTDPAVRLGRFAHAVQLAAHTGDRERLIILAGYASSATDPALGAIADTLRQRYPDELRGYLYAAQAAIMAGEFMRALPPLDSAIARDSARIALGTTSPCIGCEALAGRANAWIGLDSLGRAEREARRWLRLAPTSSIAQLTLSAILDREGRPAEAVAALERAASLDPTLWSVPILRAEILVRTGLYPEAITAMKNFTVTAPARYRAEGYWMLALAEREAGDGPAALADARRYRQADPTAPVPGSATASAALEAQLLVETGRPQAGAALFDSIGRNNPPGTARSSAARTRAWGLVHAADAWYAAGDTGRLQALADSAEIVGALSGLARDQRLYHHIRGLIAFARGRLPVAEQEFTQAIYSWSDGYTRTNLMLARTLAAEGKRPEAQRVLRAALDGPLDGSALYVSRRELKEELRRVSE